MGRARLNNHVANQALDIDMFRWVAEGNVDPDRTPSAVGMLRERFGDSERRACKVVTVTTGHP